MNIFSGLLPACFIACMLLFSACNNIQEPADYVDPFIGTGGHGHTFPGATMPFGMVQLSPDARTGGWDWCSGYHWSDSSLLGFSHTHLSGTGVGDYGDILIVPQSGSLQLQAGSVEKPDEGYRSRFSHNSEKASPGYYSVWLADPAINAELTATTRTGMHRYKYTRGEEAFVLIDLDHGIQDKTTGAYIEILTDSTFRGYRYSEGWAHCQRLYFYGEFSCPAKMIQLYNEGQEQKGRELAGRKVQAAFDFGDLEGEPLLLKVALSAVDMEGARMNMSAELPHWDFEAVAEKAHEAWNKQLSKIQVQGDAISRRIFYTSLYHSMIAPNLYQDADGRYRGHDDNIHTTDKEAYYTVFSLWDTYRATHPLFTIIDPERVNGFVRTFLLQHEQGGRLPVWELAANETDCMIGYHSVSVIADAYIKGIRDYDAPKALEAMVHTAGLDHYGQKAYREYGYIPYSEDSESVSKTLEYAYDDWAISRMATAMGRDSLAEIFRQRAQYYKNMYDPSSGFMRARSNATWFRPFDPREVNFNYTEANAWQYSFYVPHDVKGLAQLHGGKEALINKLDSLFAAGSRTSGRKQSDITGLIGQYAHGNEPSHHMAYLYACLGQPWKTQQRVQQIMETLYHDAPDGLSGNEDCGQMSSWYVFSAMGLYPLAPGDPYYVLGSPRLRKAQIRVGPGKIFTIRADKDPRKNIYVQDVLLNGQPLGRGYIKHDEITNGGELLFKMGRKPNTSLATADSCCLPSAIDSKLIHPVPYVAWGRPVFDDTTLLQLGCPQQGARIFYTLNGKKPSAQSAEYIRPMLLRYDTRLRAVAVSEGMPQSMEIRARFHKIPGGRSLHLLSKYAPQYAAGGSNALIDHMRGTGNYSTGLWQGYHGKNLEAVIDLGVEQNINKTSIGFLQDQNAWIFLPRQVQFLASDDGENFRSLGTISHNISPHTEGVVLHDFELKETFRARYLKVVAESLISCPDWHKGAGNPCWIFTDEWRVE